MTETASRCFVLQETSLRACSTPTQEPSQHEPCRAHTARRGSSSKAAFQLMEGLFFLSESEQSALTEELPVYVYEIVRE